MAVKQNLVHSCWAGWVGPGSYSAFSARGVQESDYETLFIRGSGRVELLIVSTNIMSLIGTGMCLRLLKLLFRVALLCYE